MNRTSAQALSVARPIITGLTVVNILYATSITVLLSASFVTEGWPWKQLGFDLATMHAQAGNALRMIMVIGIVCAAIVHTILRRLVVIVDTVRAGDPFILANARRLHLIACSVLGIELFRLLVLAIANGVSLPGQMGGITPAPWLAVLLLFVLSGVFAQGAQMRTDLEGTV